MISHIAIFEYWKEKYLTSNGKVISYDEFPEHSHESPLPVVHDWGEPSCWACGLPIIGPYEQLCDAENRGIEYERVWKDPGVTHNLERCHILAKQFGGHDKAENLFLLCSKCHKASPDTRSRDAFFRWVYQKRKVSLFGIQPEVFLKAVKEEIEARGYSDEMFATMFALAKITPQDMLDGSDEHIGLHGFSVSDSSLVAGYVNIIEELIHKRALENATCGS